jgi:hypothetical protein
MVKYFPSFRVRTNLNTNGSEFLLDGKPYVGKYYLTYDGSVYTGENPSVGTNKKLEKIQYNSKINYELPSNSAKNNFSINKISRSVSTPTPYYFNPLPSDYQRGYITRYFIKKINDKGYVIEISGLEYTDVVNGSANYDVSMYMTTKILWKLTGPLNKVRVSQYDTRAGIIDTNERLVLEAEKTFVGIKDFIGGEYAKFAKPTK